mmetsp:Transcript_3088/g.8983  ORF Transcript_3088/g.8983 Transcript_3088/m.8983 type:complete len:217 (+) Transcript_3088:900-1550(+)
MLRCEALWQLAPQPQHAGVLATSEAHRNADDVSTARPRAIETHLGLAGRELAPQALKLSCWWRRQVVRSNCDQLRKREEQAGHSLREDGASPVTGRLHGTLRVPRQPLRDGRLHRLLRQGGALRRGSQLLQGLRSRDAHGLRRPRLWEQVDRASPEPDAILCGVGREPPWDLQGGLDEDDFAVGIDDTANHIAPLRREPPQQVDNIPFVFGTVAGA